MSATDSTPRGPWEAIDRIHKSTLRPIEKSLLVSVAKMSDRREKICYASLATFSRETGFSYRSVRRAVVHLSNGLGIISATKRTGNSSILEIDWDKLNPGLSGLGRSDPGQTVHTPRSDSPGTLASVATKGTTKGTTGGKPSTAAKAAKGKEYTPEFLEAWQVYPERSGGNPQPRAFAAWRARLREGVKPGELIAGVQRYRNFCEAEGKIGTPYVMQAATFFGPDENFMETWKVSVETKKGGSRAAETTSKNLAVRERAHRRANAQTDG